MGLKYLPSVPCYQNYVWEIKILSQDTVDNLAKYAQEKIELPTGTPLFLYLERKCKLWNHHKISDYVIKEGSLIEAREKPYKTSDFESPSLDDLF